MKKGIKHLDEYCAIAKKDIIYVTFHPKDQDDTNAFHNATNKYDYKSDATRDKVLSDLTEMGFVYLPCYSTCRIDSQGEWRGEVVLGVDYDETDSQYQELEQYFENDDGTMKIESVRFCYFPHSYLALLDQYISNTLEDDLIEYQTVDTNNNI
jgi:hypothetical protein